MVPQIFMLFLGESKHEVIWEPFHVPCHCTIECFCLYLKEDLTHVRNNANMPKE